MTFDLDLQQERLIEAAIAAGVISSAEEVVSLGLDAIRQRLETRHDAADPEGWALRFREWVHGHPQTTPLLSL